MRTNFLEVGDHGGGETYCLPRETGEDGKGYTKNRLLPARSRP
jgi:hypothetical protein